MSEKFKIDSIKFLYNDEYIENDLDILENVSTIRQEPGPILREPVESEPILELNSENNNNPKD